MSSDTVTSPEEIMANVNTMMSENGFDPATATPEATERWLFPRFALRCEKKDKAGVKCNKAMDHDPSTGKWTCAVHKKDKKEMPQDLQYLSRRGVTPYDSDVETLVGWLEAPRHIVGMVVLLGNPGTGKTALIEAAAFHAEREMLTVLCTPDHNKDNLFLRFVGEGKGDVLPGYEESDPEAHRSPFTLGPIPYAAKHGLWLYLDEALLLVDGVKPLLYPLADGRHILPEGNVDGSGMEIHPDFRLIISSNPLVRGASLPEPIASRAAGTTLTIETDEALLLDLGIEESVVGAWTALRVQKLWTPEIRELRVASYWLTHGSPDQAISAMMPEHCPESERKTIRDYLANYLGGESDREDGRLVIS